MGCGRPLGQGPVSVIGQQVGNKALIVGTHETCRSSEWVRFEDVEELRVPWSGHGTAVTVLPVWHISPWRRVRDRLGSRPPTTPVLLVLPWLGWAWVEIVGPGETVNDDLSLYRTLGFAPGGASVPLAEARAWFTSEGNLAVTVKDHPFGTNEPVTTEMRTRIQDAGVVTIVVASGVEIRHNESVRWSDLSDAMAEGRMLTGEVELGPPPP
jgi:hypothetical protein